MLIYFSPKCLEYKQQDHPEAPERIKRIYEVLKDKYKIKEPQKCKEEDLLCVHTKEMVEKVKNESFFETGDNPKYENIYDYACLSAGSAIQAMESALNKENAFSLMRPPGHHAGKDFFEGFCYFNNIAIAVKKALKKLDKIAILDFDVHHGNGTQDIFLGNENVLYVSLHQSPLYPGTGSETIKNCINFPLSPGTNQEDYLKTFDKAIEKIKDFKPELLAISAGFDVFKEEYIASLNLDIDGFSEIGKRISNLINKLDINTFIVMEGGYSNKVGECVSSFLKHF